MIRLTDQEFRTITGFMKETYGINLINKRELIEARLYSVLLEKGLNNFTDYFKLVKQNNDELTVMLNKLTTNHTYFMREPEHFEFLRDIILPEQKKSNRTRDLRIWSAGCSSGEEAYTAIMVISDFLGLEQSEWDYRILATDISLRVMDAAQKGIYNPETLKNMPQSWERKYFSRLPNGQFALKDDVKKQVIFKRLNLMEPFPFMRPFDLIFCRNVMIYFEQQTRDRLIEKFYDMLKPGGYFFIGHSETIQRTNTKFKYLRPSIYQKG